MTRTSKLDRRWLLPFALLALLGVTLIPGAVRAKATPSAATSVVSAAEATAELPLDPAVLHGKLPNGLTYFIQVNHKPENRAELRLAVDAGSVLEDEDQRGLAHFVEHMGFNGTRHFEKQELVDYLERLGVRFGADLNAHTSFDETVYQLTVPTDDEATLKKAFLILADWASGVSFEDEEVELERGVVLEEMRLRLGASRRMWDKHYPVLFRDSRYAERLTIGTKEVLESAPPDALRRYYRDWYRPELMAVIAVGDFEPTRIEKLIKKRFGKLRSPDEPRKRTVFPVPDHDETLVSIAVDPEATSTSLSVYYKLPKRPDETVADFRRQTIESLYHWMVGDRLDERRQEPDPPFLYAGSSTGRLVRSRDLFVLSVNVEDTGLVRGLEAVLTEMERVDRHGFTASELERTKKSLLRYLEQSWRERDKRNSAGLAYQLENHFLDGTPAMSLDDRLELTRQLLPSIGLEEVNHLAREWVSDRNRVILVNAPEKEGLEIPTEQALLATFARVDRAEVAPYVDRVRDEPLLQATLEPAEIVERSEIPEIGVTQWRLANGVRVIVKPTTFKNDEVSVTGISPGGHSLVPDDRYVSAIYAGSLVHAGGIGEFSRIELDKALAGRVVSVSSSLGELEESVSASASPEDLEIALQLIYLHFTAPRKDAEAFEAWRVRQEGALENRLSRPETAFADKYTETMFGNHFRRRPPTIERLRQVDLDAALAAYRQRFADAGDFTFVIVGNVDLEALEPLVRTYLGSLPSNGREESWKDLGIRPPAELTRFEVRRGIEDKSQVRITFTGDAPWSEEQDHILGSLAQLLRIRLREVLREDMGATYGVSVGGGLSRRPREEYGFSIGFGCAPANVEPTIQAIFEEIRALKTNGVERSYVDKIREMQTREREVDLKENSFWRYQLLSRYRYGDDPRGILAYDALVRAVTPEALQAAAQRYLNEERYVLGVLYPEKSEGGEVPAAAAK